MVERDGWNTLAGRTEAFTASLERRFRDAHLDLDIVRHASIFWIRRRTASPIRTPDRIPAEQAKWYARYFHAALARGVYLPPSSYEVCFTSMAHDETVLAEAADILVDAAVAAES